MNPSFCKHALKREAADIMNYHFAILIEQAKNCKKTAKGIRKEVI
jgi:hypothetical protein